MRLGKALAQVAALEPTGSIGKQALVSPSEGEELMRPTSASRDRRISDAGDTGVPLKAGMRQ